MSYTKGPWKADCRDISYIEGTAWPKDEFLQWEVIGPKEPIGRGSFYQEDAQLIAAAPDLLEALEAIINDGIHCDVVPHLHTKAMAAIKKARGEA